MKQLLNTLIILVVALSSFNFSGSANTKPKVAIITFATETINYGTILQHSKGSKIVSFKNNGTAPLVINEVKTSCGCTVTSYVKTAILPGAYGEIKLKYDTKRLGNFSKSITIVSNAKGGNKTLKIKGKVIKQKS